MKVPRHSSSPDTERRLSDKRIVLYIVIASFSLILGGWLIFVVVDLLQSGRTITVAAIPCFASVVVLCVLRRFYAAALTFAYSVCALTFLLGIRMLTGSGNPYAGAVVTVATLFLPCLITKWFVRDMR
jgi:hypothetical protein